MPSYPDRPTTVNSDAPFDLPPPPNPQASQFYSWCIALWQWTVKFGQNIRGSVTTLSSTVTSGLAGKLNKTSADTLQAVLDVQASSTAGIKIGTITWNSSGVLTGGTGVAITANGIVGALAGSPKFVIQSDGTATFGGNLSAPGGDIGGFTIGASSLSVTAAGKTTVVSSGATAFSAGTTASPEFKVTSAGAVTASNLTITGGSVNVSSSTTSGGYNAAIIGTASSAGYIGVLGQGSTIGYGVFGEANNDSYPGGNFTNTSNSGIGCRGTGGQYGVYGTTSKAGGYGGYFEAASGTALQINGTSYFSGAITANSTINGTTIPSSSTLLTSGGALGTPSSGTLTNCTFPTLNQNTTGSAATLTTARNIGGTSFNGSASIDPIQTKHAGDNSICSFAGSPGATTYPLVYTTGKNASGGSIPALNRNADDGGTMSWYWVKVWSGSQFIYMPYMA